jgi:hypothetical protein
MSLRPTWITHVSKPNVMIGDPMSWDSRKTCICNKSTHYVTLSNEDVILYGL